MKPKIDEENTQKSKIFGATKSKEKKTDFEGIKKQAKEILDKFAKELEKVEKETGEDFYVDREDFERIEGDGKESPKGFKERFLKNAPKHDDDFIIAEKGSWK